MQTIIAGIPFGNTAGFSCFGNRQQIAYLCRLFLEIMISRRNIRVKVMQVLYSLEATNNEISPADAITILNMK